MSLGRYYRTLGLPATATIEEVRKRYRKLVMQYHPDKNPSPGAAKKFVAIAEAYEIITGKRPSPVAKQKRSTPQKRKTAPNKSTTNTKAHEERVREARTRYEDQQKKEHLENERYYRLLTNGQRWKMMRLSAILGAILATCMILDRFLPHHFEEDLVTHYALNRAYNGNGEILGVVRTEKGHDYWISHINYTLYGKSPKISTETSWIFHEPISVVTSAKVQNVKYDVFYTFFSNFIVIIVLFLLPAVTYFYKRRTITFTLLFQFCLYAINALFLFFLFSNDHWAHMLTLGFI